MELLRPNFAMCSMLARPFRVYHLPRRPDLCRALLPPGRRALPRPPALATPRRLVVPVAVRWRLGVGNLIEGRSHDMAKNMTRSVASVLLSAKNLKLIRSFTSSYCFISRKRFESISSSSISTPGEYDDAVNRSLLFKYVEIQTVRSTNAGIS